MSEAQAVVDGVTGVATENSTLVISCKSELKFDPDEVLKRLEMNSQNYFNAGFMIIDLEKWRTQQIKAGLIQTLEKKQESLKYWDQDLLNSFFDGNYVDIDEKFNLQDGLVTYGEFDLDSVNKFKLTNYLSHDTIKANMAV